MRDAVDETVITSVEINILRSTELKASNDPLFGPTKVYGAVLCYFANMHKI